MKAKTYMATDRINWHNRLGHAPDSAITQTALLVKGLEKEISHPTVDCEICLESNSTRESFKSAEDLIRDTRETLNFVHSALCGPMGLASVCKEKYFVTCYDDTSAVLIVRFIQTKDQTGCSVSKMITELESVAANRGRIRRIRIDNGGK